MVYSPPHPSTVQREIVEPMEIVEPVDFPRDIAVGRKRHAWPRQTL
jgi:hypothetical protein